MFALALAVALIASVAPGYTMPCCKIPQTRTIQTSVPRHCPMHSCSIPHRDDPATNDLCAQPVTPPADGVGAVISSNWPALDPIDEVPPAAATIAHLANLDHKPPTSSSPPAVYLLDGAFLI
jgi:hypothetical protein